MYHVGQYINRKGNFTTARFILGFSSSDLERIVGFESGRLSSGYIIVSLAAGEVIRPNDLELKASTRWSGGQVGSPGSTDKKEIEDLIKLRNQDVGHLKEKVCAFFAARGRNTPAKVIPRVPHSPGMLYPDAEALEPGIRTGVPQFNLIVEKRFVVVEVV